MTSQDLEQRRKQIADSMSTSEHITYTIKLEDELAELRKNLNKYIKGIYA